MTKAILWLTVTIGFGWTALMAIPAASVAVLTLAQGSPATFEVIVGVRLYRSCIGGYDAHRNGHGFDIV